MEQLARSLHTAAPNVPAVFISTIHTTYAVYYTKYSTVCLYVDLEPLHIDGLAVVGTQLLVFRVIKYCTGAVDDIQGLKIKS
jgi:hypothetical protein